MIHNCYSMNSTCRFDYFGTLFLHLSSKNLLINEWSNSNNKWNIWFYDARRTFVHKVLNPSRTILWHPKRAKNTVFHDELLWSEINTFLSILRVCVEKTTKKIGIVELFAHETLTTHDSTTIWTTFHWTSIQGLAS